MVEEKTTLEAAYNTLIEEHTGLRAQLVSLSTLYRARDR